MDVSHKGRIKIGDIILQPSRQGILGSSLKPNRIFTFKISLLVGNDSANDDEDAMTIPLGTQKIVRLHVHAGIAANVKILSVDKTSRCYDDESPLIFKNGEVFEEFKLCVIDYWQHQVMPAHGELWEVVLPDSGPFSSHVSMSAAVQTTGVAIFQQLCVQYSGAVPLDGVICEQPLSLHVNNLLQEVCTLDFPPLLLNINPSCIPVCIEVLHGNTPITRMIDYKVRSQLTDLSIRFLDGNNMPLEFQDDWLKGKSAGVIISGPEMKQARRHKSIHIDDIIITNLNGICKFKVDVVLYNKKRFDCEFDVNVISDEPVSWRIDMRHGTDGIMYDHEYDMLDKIRRVIFIDQFGNDCSMIYYQRDHESARLQVSISAEVDSSDDVIVGGKRFRDMNNVNSNSSRKKCIRFDDEYSNADDHDDDYNMIETDGRVVELPLKLHLDEENDTACYKIIGESGGK